MNALGLGLSKELGPFRETGGGGDHPEGFLTDPDEDFYLVSPDGSEYLQRPEEHE